MIGLRRLEKEMEKWEKIEKFIAPKLMIVETSGWRHLKEKNKLFLSCEYPKMYHPSPKTAQLSKIAANQKLKTLFLPSVSKCQIM